jgi:hypothetical protein
MFTVDGSRVGGESEEPQAGPSRRVKTSKAPRQPWHLRHRRQFRICKLQILQGPTWFESAERNDQKSVDADHGVPLSLSNA